MLIRLVVIGTLVVEMFSVRHVISQDHKFKATCDFIGGSPTRQVTTLPSLVTKGIVVEEM